MGIPNLEQFGELQATIRRVQHGKLLVSDAVMEHIDTLFDFVMSLPWRPWSNPGDWEQAVTLDPAAAKVWLESLEELQHLAGEIEKHYAGGGEVLDDVGTPIVFDPESIR